jgi:hypothetical protein
MRDRYKEEPQTEIGADIGESKFSPEQIHEFRRRTWDAAQKVLGAIYKDLEATHRTEDAFSGNWYKVESVGTEPFPAYWVRLNGQPNRLAGLDIQIVNALRSPTLSDRYEGDSFAGEGILLKVRSGGDTWMTRKHLYLSHGNLEERDQEYGQLINDPNRTERPYEIVDIIEEIASHRFKSVYGTTFSGERIDYSQYEQARSRAPVLRR